MLGFELWWYTQHRASHDIKFLYRYGHSFHHQWQKPEDMIGITNFAFDHIVETYVSMSTSFYPTLIFPINYWAKVFISLSYMMVAIMSHWDKFPYKYHLDHHYQIIANYGALIQIFDKFFGTYYSQEKKVHDK